MSILIEDVAEIMEFADSPEELCRRQRHRVRLPLIYDRRLPSRL
jgi:hypothetical protein